MRNKYGKYRFNLKTEHLNLLQRFVVGWNGCEFGAPTIDPKRPYGDSNVYQSMINILGLKELRDGVYEFTLDGEKWILKGEDKNSLYLDGKDEEKLTDKLRILHEETKEVLQICLSSLKFEEGTFEKIDYGNWKKVE